MTQKQFQEYTITELKKYNKQLKKHIKRTKTLEKDVASRHKIVWGVVTGATIWLTLLITVIKFI